jgi:hypothetical protein
MEPSQNPQPSQNDTDELGTAQQPTVAPNPGQYPGQNMPQVVQVMRPLNPMAQEIPEDIKRRCEESKHRYPHLNLSPGEFVIDSVQRHPVGVFKIWALIGVLIFTVMLLAVFTTSIGGGTMVSGAATSILLIGALLLAVFFVLGGIIATYIYNSNHFYLTNESVIQEIMFSLFSRNVQTVSLSNIEDASFRQNGILPHLLNYGDIRLSTEGDETTYRFSYVANPNQHIARLNNAVEAFKNGRPIPYSTDDQPS